MARVRRRTLLFVAILAAVALVSYRPLLTAAGAFLTLQDLPEKSDAAVVLRGEDTDGLRLEEAARLYRDGWTPKIVLSGALFPFGLHETDLSLPWALEMGLPREILVPIISDATGSWAEAQALAPALEKAGFRSVILISSETDARRLRVVWRKAAPRLLVRVRTVRDPRFSADTWWLTREGQKAFFYGWTGLIRAWLR